MIHPSDPETQRRMYRVHLVSLGERRWVDERQLYVRCVGEGLQTRRPPRVRREALRRDHEA